MPELRVFVRVVVIVLRRWRWAVAAGGSDGCGPAHNSNDKRAAANRLGFVVWPVTPPPPLPPANNNTKEENARGSRF